MRSRCPVLAERMVGTPQASASMAARLVPPSARLTKTAASTSLSQGAREPFETAGSSAMLSSGTPF